MYRIITTSLFITFFAFGMDETLFSKPKLNRKRMHHECYEQLRTACITQLNYKKIIAPAAEQANTSPITTEAPQQKSAKSKTIAPGNNVSKNIMRHTLPTQNPYDILRED
ncbi:MAG: hypothetical protein M1114_00135 [Candidatus Dependentiae bacterium]|nr:hypothetical protein [Candidatus Dependentiae bacterium]